MPAEVALIPAFYRRHNNKENSYKCVDVCYFVMFIEINIKCAIKKYSAERKATIHRVF